MEVKEVLKVKGSKLFAVHPDSLLSEAVIMMAENDIGSVVVTDGGKLVGILTFREVLLVLAKRQTERRVGPTPPIAEILVSEAMHTNPPTTDASMDLDELRRLMVSTHDQRHFLPRCRQSRAGGTQLREQTAQGLYQGLASGVKPARARSILPVLSEFSYRKQTTMFLHSITVSHPGNVVGYPARLIALRLIL